MAPTLLLALLLSTKTIPLQLNDIHAVSTTNGQSTLVAWTNQFSSNRAAWRVFVRLMDSPLDRQAVSLGAGFSPRVATNGRDYLVGWSGAATRFTQFVADSTVIQLVSADGVPGARKVLSRSVLGGATDVAWNGTHWMVSYYFSESGRFVSRVVLFDDSLNVVATITPDQGIVRALRRIDDRWWAFSDVEALEILDDGTIGQRFFHNQPIEEVMFVTHGPRPLLLLQGIHVDAIPFDPATGFGVRRPLASSTTFFGDIPYAGGSLLLFAPIPTTQYDVAFVDESGELRSQTPVLFTRDPQYPYASLGLSVNGPLLFHSPEAPTSWATGAIDLYVYRLGSLAPLDPMSGERVSQLPAPNERRRAARH